MRVKLSKLLSAVLAICIVFVGFTAFAATTPTVTVSTTYDYNTHGLDTPASADITVYANVEGVDDNTEVTFLVNGTSKIVYIDQQTAASGASFKFTANWQDVESASVSLGSDGEYTLPKTFEINPTVNHWTNGSLVAESAVTSYEETIAYNEQDEVFAADCASYAFTGKVNGDVKEFGIKLADTEFRAMGCADDGTFIVVVKNITAADAAAAKVYCK